MLLPLVRSLNALATGWWSIDSALLAESLPGVFWTCCLVCFDGSVAVADRNLDTFGVLDALLALSRLAQDQGVP